MSETAGPYRTSTYYVKADFTVERGKVTADSYEYTDESGSHKQPVAEDMLANAQGGNVDFVGFTMKSANFKNLSDVAQKYTAKLYGAVALTLGEREEVANTILSRDGEKLIVPIYKGTKRGVILIFQIFEDGKLVQIVGTPDPEIGNSTSGT